MSNLLELYVHIPFCIRKCDYCDFLSFPSTEEQQYRYMEALKKEIQEYVKEKTAPYKYPRIVVFRDELPKTISGKIIRNRL